MKSFIQLSTALLATFLALAHAKAESIFDRRVEVDGASRRLYDLLLESTVNQQQLRRALDYYDQAESALPNKRFLALIDYSLPSDEKRFFLFDLRTGKVERFLVAHGRASGQQKALHFSDRDKSAMSSLGFYRTGAIYNGKNGKSLRLQGLSRSNSNAQGRDIVIHSAGLVSVIQGRKVVKVPYVGEEILKAQGRLGRSLGCFALDPKVGSRVIEILKNGALLYAFN